MILSQLFNKTRKSNISRLCQLHISQNMKLKRKSSNSKIIINKTIIPKNKEQKKKSDWMKKQQSLKEKFQKFPSSNLFQVQINPSLQLWVRLSQEISNISIKLTLHQSKQKKDCKSRNRLRQEGCNLLNGSIRKKNISMVS